MAKLYTKQNVAISKMTPSKETINFIINFSKALKVIKVGNKSFEFIAN
ncbi:MAG: hypothetical protein H7239_15715 [Flavobacterium sp.]|nr:hypothetical protein [Flavobacterium sp.]